MTPLWVSVRAQERELRKVVLRLCAGVRRRTAATHRPEPHANPARDQTLNRYKAPSGDGSAPVIPPTATTDSDPGLQRERRGADASAPQRHGPRTFSRLPGTASTGPLGCFQASGRLRGTDKRCTTCGIVRVWLDRNAH